MARRMALGVVALASAGAVAQSPAAPDRRAIDQREALVRRLVFDSPSEQRIASSDNEEAKVELARARAFHARARALADAGNLAQAQSELSAAMRAIARARNLVPDAMARSADERARYAGRLRTVEALARSYETRLASAGTLPADEERLAQARTGIEGAKALANEGNPGEAARALEKPERELMAGLNAMLGSTTLRYTRHFESVEDEYSFELERNRSYLDLVPVAIAQLKPRREAIVLVDRYVAANAKLIEAAVGHATGRRFREAADVLRSGTNNLQSALAAAGLAVPGNIGANQ